MKNYIILILSILAIAYTLWYMSLGNLTENSGALSKTGLAHPILFIIWGVLVFTALYSGIITLYKRLLPKFKIHIVISALALIGMILTLSCRFDYALKTEYYLHCAGSLTFSVSTGITVFLLYLLNFKKGAYYSVLCIAIGIILSVDAILLIAFKESALIEAVPILFGLIIIPATVFKSTEKKEKTYASR